MKYVWSTFRQNNVWQTFSTQLKWAKRPNWMKFSGQLSLSKGLISQSSVSIWPNEKMKRRNEDERKMLNVDRGRKWRNAPLTTAGALKWIYLMSSISTISFLVVGVQFCDLLGHAWSKLKLIWISTFSWSIGKTKRSMIQVRI